MKSIGIKLADGSFYPLLEEGNPEKRTLDLTTVMDNQTKVQVEVYRTETGTLEGAEYLDTLEIKNLKPHENGEPTLCLAIDVDENNELSAEIRDPETGKKSEIQVTLQSRTLAGLNNTDFEYDDDVTISDNDLEKAGLDDFMEKKEFESEEIPLPAEDFSFDDVNEPSHADDTILKEETETIETEDSEPIEGNEESAQASEDDIFGENSLDLPEFGDTMDAEENSAMPESEPEEDNTAVTEESIDDTAISEETAAEDDSLNADEDFSSTDLPAFDETMFDSAEESSSTVNDETLPDFNDDIFAETTEETNDSSLPDDITMTDNLDLPDFDESESVPEDTSEELADSTDEMNASDLDLDLPDFDDLDATSLDTSTSDTSSFDSSFSLPDFDDETSDSLTDNDEDFTLPPDFDTNYGEENLTFDEQPKNPTFAPSTSMFSNLYDKETLEGTSSSYDYGEDKDSSSKTKVPVIICVVCAIICILAVLLTLFVIPSKLNIFSKSEKTVSEENVVSDSAENIPEETSEFTTDEIEIEPEEVAPAKEDTIVIAETPAAVVPVEPEPVPEKIPDIRYKIVWGDTLWDISTAYYKTPWKYKKLARYNKIKNPDHIISGTYILIPAE